MKIYMLHHDNIISGTVFYKTKELARIALKKKRDEIIRRCVNVIEDSEDKFHFCFGWEGHDVSWRVSELEVLETE